jgi:hypothetical protein
MKQIPLTQGLFALVDDEDFEFLTTYGKWFAHKCRRTYYAETKVKGVAVKMHRLLLSLLPGDPIQADHRDHNGLNNQKENLFYVTHAENMQNKQTYRNNKSGTPGVYYKITAKGRKYWHAQITHNKKQRLIGRFLTQEEAVEARLKAEKELV